MVVVTPRSMQLKTLANTTIRREIGRLNTRIVVLCVSFAHAGGGLNQRICDVNGQYVRCSGAPDCPTYPMGCGGALVRQHTPTSSHNHRLGVLWVWWVWVGLEVNMTVMRPSMVIYRPGMVQTDGRSYPQVRASENTRKHPHMTGNKSTKHPHCG